MAQYNFGTGDLFTSQLDGSEALKIGALQDVSIDFSGDIKQLFGQYQFPLDVARGKSKIEGKAATGNMDVQAFNSFYFGTGVDVGETVRAINEPGAVPAMTTYTITVDNDADFVQDLGVFLVSTGAALKQVAAMPAAGQYSVNVATGVYTFNSAQASAAVLINYLYTKTTGHTVVLNNELMGASPSFKLVLSQLYKGKTFSIVLYNCVAEKLSMPLKMDDYTISDFSFQAQASDAGPVGYISTSV